MDRHYTSLTIEKAFDEGDERIIEGFATTPDEDRKGDIVDPEGVEYKLPLPLLWQHDSLQPVGTVEKVTVTKRGIRFRARLAKVDGPPALKNRIDEAWSSVKAGLIHAVSIGFRATTPPALLESGGVRFLKWMWLELSLVTIPANPNATITQIRAYHDERGMTAAHARRGLPVTPARVAATSQKSFKGKNEMNVAEMIKALEEDIKRKEDERNAIQKTALDAGRTKDIQEKENFDRLQEEIEGMESELEDLKKIQAKEVKKAAPVEAKTGAEAGASRGGRDERIFFNNKRAEQGIGFAHAMMCVAVARQSGISAVELAKEHYSYDERIAALCKGLLTKAAVAGAVPTAPAWAGSLMNPQDLVTEFVEYMWAGAIIGKLPGVTRVPFNYKISRQTGATTANWTGAGKPAPVSKGALDQITIGTTSLTGLTYFAKQNLKFSNIDAERLVRNTLAGSLRTLADADFVDPANAGTANIKPASVTNGVTPVPPTGTDGDAATTDIKNVLQTLVNANLDISEAAIIMRGDMALGLSTLKNALGQAEFPDLGPAGGTLLKLPVVVSNSVQPGDIIAVHQPSIYVAKDDDVTIDMSTEASLEALDSTLLQDGADGTGAASISMFQSRMVAFLAELYANWVVGRTGSVACITAGNYNGTPTA